MLTVIMEETLADLPADYELHEMAEIYTMSNTLSLHDALPKKRREPERTDVQIITIVVMHEEQNMRSQIKEKKNNSGTETNRMLRYLVSFVVIILLLAILFFWNIGVGSVEMSFFDFLGVLTKHQPDSTLYQIVWKIRLPRIIAAVLLGGALSVSGFLLQSFFQNPIAGPYVLGISSGAKLVVALTMIFLLEKGIMVSSLGMVVAAFAGSLLAMGFVQWEVFPV